MVSVVIFWIILFPYPFIKKWFRPYHVYFFFREGHGQPEHFNGWNAIVWIFLLWVCLIIVVSPNWCAYSKHWTCVYDVTGLSVDLRCCHLMHNNSIRCCYSNQKISSWCACFLIILVEKIHAVVVSFLRYDKWFINADVLLGLDVFAFGKTIVVL